LPLESHRFVTGNKLPLPPMASIEPQYQLHESWESDELLVERNVTLTAAELPSTAVEERQYILLNAAPAG